MNQYQSYRSDFVTKEAQKVKTPEGQRNTWFNRAMTLCQLGCSAKKKSGVVLVLLY